MTLYDKFISQITELLGVADKSFSIGKDTLRHSSKNDILFLKDTAFELGGSNKKCVSTVVTSSDTHFFNNILLYGNDIKDIKEDCPFGKIVFLEIEDIDEDTAFDKIKELETLRYSFYREGFMTRASALSMREQIRVSKKAVKSKVSLSDYGTAVINEYLKNPLVKSVQVIIITKSEFLDELCIIADKIKNTTSALNHILDNVMFDCKSCNLKEICDEVEGMKELHIKQSKNQNR